MLRTVLSLCISLVISATPLHASGWWSISLSSAFWNETHGGFAVRTDHTRPQAIRAKTIHEAVDLILGGHIVEVPDTRSVNTLLTTLAAMAEEARKLGKDAPHYDLCNVTVPGTNVFCADRLRSEQYPYGVPRFEMPQLGGEPIPGTKADELPRNPWDPKEVDGASAFIEGLAALCIRIERGQVPVAQLKASQAEIDGGKVAKMMVNERFDPARNPVFISRDNYIVDGHHRWAAMVGRDVDAPISEVLHLANTWSLKFGIKPVTGPGVRQPAHIQYATDGEPRASGEAVHMCASPCACHR